MGPRYIRAWRPNQTQPSFWNSATYKAKVFRRTPTGVFTEITTGISGNWTLTSLNTGNQAPLGFSQASNPDNTECSVTAQTAESNLTDQSTWELSYICSAAGLSLQYPVTANVVVTGRRHLDTHFYFPKSMTGNGHSTRSFPGTTGGNTFFASDTTTRLQARHDFVTMFAQETAKLTRYAGVNLYWTINEDSPILPGFDMSGNYIARDAMSNVTPAFDGLMESGAPNYALKVYFVHGITSVGLTSVDVWGITHGEAVWADPPLYTTTLYQGRIILIGDDGRPSTLAHELVHALGHHHHIQAWSEISGKLNNLKDIMASSTIMTSAPTSPNNPLNWNMMREYSAGRILGSDGDYITDKQGSRAYYHTSLHPFFRLTD